MEIALNILSLEIVVCCYRFQKPCFTLKFALGNLVKKSVLSDCAPSWSELLWCGRSVAGRVLFICLVSAHSLLSPRWVLKLSGGPGI